MRHDSRVMPDGRLLTFDKTSGVARERLLAAACSALRSEKVEVSYGNDIDAQIGISRSAAGLLPRIGTRRLRFRLT